MSVRVRPRVQTLGAPEFQGLFWYDKSRIRTGLSNYYFSVLTTTYCGFFIDLYAYLISPFFILKTNFMFKLIITLNFIVLAFSNCLSQTMVKDINPIAKKDGIKEMNGNSSTKNIQYSLITSFQDHLILIATDSTYNSGLWKSDGTSEGTTCIGNIYVTGSKHLIAKDSNYLYFMANINGQAGIWKYELISIENAENTGKKGGLNKKLTTKINTSDNNEKLPAGISLIKELDQSLTGINLINVGGKILICIKYYDNPYEVWSTDGTKKGTANTGIKINNYYKGHLQNLLVWKNNLYYVHKDENHGYELWQTDGTITGTKIVADINQKKTKTGDTEGSSPKHLTALDDYITFIADDGIHGVELWKTDGTGNGTLIVMDLQSDIGSSGPNIDYDGRNFCAISNTLYFTVGSDLWKSDGTETGTKKITTLRYGKKQSNGSIFYEQHAGEAYYFTNVNGTLFFALHDGIHGAELWKSDGTESGTFLVKDICPGNQNGLIGPLGEDVFFTVFDGYLFFVANDGVNGRELWKSDGTENGTVLVKDINTNGNYGSDPMELIIVNNTLYFSADDGPHGRELWKYE